MAVIIIAHGNGKFILGQIYLDHSYSAFSLEAYTLSI